MEFLLWLALIPAAALAVLVYFTDRVEKEPGPLIMKVIAFGALSTIPAIIAELILGAVIGAVLEEGTLLRLLIDNFIGIALVEEICKMYAAKIAIWKKPAFDYRFDGIVYCVMAALGFAALENILYVVSGGVIVAIIRALMSIPSHAIDGLIMGYFFGLAKEAELNGNKKKSRHYLRLSIFMPVLEHGFYDAALNSENVVMILLVVLFMIGIDIWAFIFIRSQAKKDYAIRKPEVEQTENLVPVQEMQQPVNPVPVQEMQQPVNPVPVQEIQQPVNPIPVQEIQQPVNPIPVQEMQQPENTVQVQENETTSSTDL